MESSQGLLEKLELGTRRASYPEYRSFWSCLHRRPARNNPLLCRTRPQATETVLVQQYPITKINVNPITYPNIVGLLPASLPNGHRRAPLSSKSPLLLSPCN